MAYSDYIVFVDESGDHNLQKIDENYPVFALSFCIFKKEDYAQKVVPSLELFKFKHFGHDTVVLHEHEIRKQVAPFVFLKSEAKREAFMNDLGTVMTDAPMTMIGAVIKKRDLVRQYVRPKNPYELALFFCMERLHYFLLEKGAEGGVTHVVVECRGKKEDAELELEFRRIQALLSERRADAPKLEIVFADKRINSSGLQLADLTARPIGLKAIKPDQPNRAYRIIEAKFRKSPHGRVEGWGFKVFP